MSGAGGAFNIQHFPFNIQHFASSLIPPEAEPLPLWQAFRNDPARYMSERPVILIADDNQDVVMLLRSYLRPLESEVLVARDGEEALAVAQSRLPDVVLLDVMMPRRS